MALMLACRRVQPRAVVYDIDPDNASILVCGGGGVAIHVTRKLKNMGSWVWQMQRTDSRRKEIEGMMAIVAKGDALVKEDVQKVFNGRSVGLMDTAWRSGGSESTSAHALVWCVCVCVCVCASVCGMTRA